MQMQMRMTVICLGFYAGLIAAWSNPEVFFAKEAEKYVDGRLLRQSYLAMALPIEQICFTAWTVNGLYYWLQFEPERAHCKSALAANPALASFVALLTQHKIRIRIVPPGTKLTGVNGIPVEIGPGPYFTPGASFQMNDVWMIYLSRETSRFGVLPANLMNDGKASEIDGGIVLIHEAGHSRNDPAPGVEGDPSNYWADHIENQLRKQRDPNAAQRRHHDPPSAQRGPGAGPTE